MKPVVVAAALLTTICGLGAAAHADIPAGYTGTPYKGTAWPLPGRIDFENFDLGGYNVGFKTEHHSKGAPIGCSGSDYRTDDDQPTMCKTNQGTEVDKLDSGTLYPSAANPVSYYIGACRPTDWVQLTVNVKTAGTYKLSSTWASGAEMIDISLFFNGIQKLNYKVASASDYHKWFPANQFAEVQLDAGVQVLKFVANREHVNYDYIQFSLVTPGGLDDGNSGVAGAGGSAGSSAGGGAGVAGSNAGGGTGGASVAGSSAGGASAAGASEVGAAGAAVAGSSASTTTAGAGGAPSAAAGAPAGSFPISTPSSQDAGCGCRLEGSSSSRSMQGLTLAAVAGALLIARGRRGRRTRM